MSAFSLKKGLKLSFSRGKQNSELTALSCKCVFVLDAVCREHAQQEMWSDAKLTLEQHSNLIESMGLKRKVITLSARGSVCLSQIYVS